MSDAAGANKTPDWPVMFVMREIFHGQKNGGVFLDDGSDALLGLLDKLSASEASATEAGASVEAHARHVSFSLQAYSMALTQLEPRYIERDWPEWRNTQVTEPEWRETRAGLKQNLASLLEALRETRGGDAPQLALALGALAHMAFHLGAIQVKYDLLKEKG
jgi:hypothetical protein